MIRWMPILRHHHMLMLVRQLIDERYYFIATIHGKRTTGAEIILHINDEQDGIFHVTLSAAAQPLSAGKGSVITKSGMVFI